MSWLILSLAGLLEITWAIGLKVHDGRPWLLTGTVVAAILSVVLLGVAVKQLPISTAYVVWTGIGIVGTVLVGATFLGESMSPAKFFWTACTVAGIIGLKISNS